MRVQLLLQGLAGTRCRGAVKRCAGLYPDVVVRAGRWWTPQTTFCDDRHQSSGQINSGACSLTRQISSARDVFNHVNARLRRPPSRSASARVEEFIGLVYPLCELPKTQVVQSAWWINAFPTPYDKAVW